MLSTTAMFVEIVIIGIGGLGAVLLLFFGLTPVALPAEPWRYFPFMIAPALALDYILGNVIDRLADRLMARWDNRYKQEFFDHGEFTYAEARTWVYIWSEPARTTFEYGKSRIRICRGWVLNALILLFASQVYVVYAPIDPVLRQPLGWFFFALFLFLLVSSAASWRILSRDHFARLAGYYAELSKFRSKHSHPITIDLVDFVGPLQESQSTVLKPSVLSQQAAVESENEGQSSANLT